MKISIDHIANLARLSLSGEERELFGSQLESILSYMDTLNELDTGAIEPTSHVLAIRNVTREDVQTPCLDREKALANAPDKTEKFYRVPKIIE
ncbi:MAG: Asp-tRNA(Asn)/Glu-tRNA(Gln) amidotransferase subunit GatC [Nitrospiraceae bacterium]|nr:Asp-tRNA(Asn)/Glu-tRNA(Gln) amidotransferase subunit GatC [Nitrospiraceae bacterium]